MRKHHTKFQPSISTRLKKDHRETWKKWGHGHTQTLDTHPSPHDGIYSVRDKNNMNTQSSLKKMCLNKDSLEGRDEDKMADLIAGCLLQIICRQSGIHISTLTDLKTSSLFFHSYHYWLTDWPLKQMRGSTWKYKELSWSLCQYALQW